MKIQKFKAELYARASIAPYLRKCGNLPIREILVISRDRTPDLPPVRPHDRHTNVE